MRALALLQRRVRNLYRREQIPRRAQKSLETHNDRGPWHAGGALEPDGPQGERTGKLPEPRVDEHRAGVVLAQQELDGPANQAAVAVGDIDQVGAAVRGYDDFRGCACLELIAAQ